MSALHLLEQQSTELGYAKALLQDFLTALDQPEDVRDTFVRYAKARAAHALRDGGRLS